MGWPLGQPKNLSLCKVGWALPSKVDKGLELRPTHVLPLYVHEEGRIGINSLALTPLNFKVGSSVSLWANPRICPCVRLVGLYISKVDEGLALGPTHPLPLHTYKGE